MVNGIFDVGQRLFIGTSEFRFLRRRDPDVWTLEDLSTGVWRDERENQLLARWKTGELRFSGVMMGNAVDAQDIARRDAAVETFRQSYPDPLWRRAQAKLLYVRRLRRAPMTEEVIKPLIKEIHENTSLWKGGAIFAHPPHFTSVAKWRRAYEESGEDIRSLCDRHHDKGNKDSRYPAEVEALADDVIETMYLTTERPTIENCLEVLRGRVARINLQRLASEQFPRPTRAYLERRISHLPKYDVAVARHGKRVAEIKFRNAGLGAMAKTPLARAAMDHCRLDLMVIDDATGLPLGRPWLTLVLDEKTRYVLGYYIGFEEPSAVSAQRAICSAISPKEELLAECPEVKNVWDAWGVMDCLVMDNGMEFHGEIVENGTGRFGITVQYCPRKKPWYKGKIERFFGTLNTGLLATIPGKTFSSILERDDYEPAKHALISLKTLQKIVLVWIVDIYHQKNHGGIDSTPSRAWSDGVGSAKRWLPPSSLSLDAAFSRTIERRLTHKGLEIDGLFYNSSDMRSLRELYGSEIAVNVRVMDDDIGSVVVVSPDQREIVRVPALEIEYARGMTRWQHLVCKRYRRRCQEDSSRDLSLYDARMEIVRLIESERAFGRRVSRRSARFGEGKSKESTVQSSRHAETSLTQRHNPTENAVEAHSGISGAHESELKGIATSEAPMAVAKQETIPVFGARVLNRDAGGTHA